MECRTVNVLDANHVFKFYLESVQEIFFIELQLLIT